MPVIKTKLVADLEQEPFDLDQIRCPSCQKIQQARIYYGRKRFKHMHKCISCGHVILKKEWDSIL